MNPGVAPIEHVEPVAHLDSTVTGTLKQESFDDGTTTYKITGGNVIAHIDPDNAAHYAEVIDVDGCTFDLRQTQQDIPAEALHVITNASCNGY